MSRYKQKNISVTPEQEKIIRENTPGKTCKELSEMLGISKNRIQANRELMGLTVIMDTAKVVDFADKNGNFCIEKWAKLVNY